MRLSPDSSSRGGIPLALFKNLRLLFGRSAEAEAGEDGERKGMTCDRGPGLDLSPRYALTWHVAQPKRASGTPQVEMCLWDCDAGFNVA